jgi:hypothetical protein
MVVIIGMIPNSSLLEITKNTYSPIFEVFSYTGLNLASIDMSDVNASMKEALLRRKRGTCPIISLMSSGPLIIYSFPLIFIVIYEHTKYSMNSSFIC